MRPNTLQLQLLENFIITIAVTLINWNKIIHLLPGLVSE